MQDFQKQFVLALLGYVVQRNVDPQRLCGLSGIEYKPLIQRTGGHLTATQINSLWKNASHICSDPLFGLHFGESMQLAALGVIGQIVQTSSNVGEALNNACALTHLITDMFEMKVQRSKKDFKIIVQFDKEKALHYPYSYRHMADYLMVFVVHELNGLLLQKTMPLSARFPYPLEDMNEYDRLFKCRIPARSTELSLEFPLNFLNQPILSANYELQNHLLQKIEVLKKDDGGSGVLRTRIYNHLLANSYLQSLTLDSVAANFNLSSRSLQRKLKEEGVTYQQIVEEVRRKLAINYLTSNYSIKDISHILGYNEQSAFVRAFKRWTKKTPMEYRGIRV
jgi:AraC-like DNA-binding protein